MKEKVIEVIKELREQQDKLYDKAIWCREHEFTLEAEKFSFAETEIRRAISKIQDKLELPYIGR